MFITFLLVAGERAARPHRKRNSTVSPPVFDHYVHVLQEIDVSQHVASHSNNVRVFALADRADAIRDAHRDRRPVRRRADGDHRVDAESVDPGVELAPRRLAVKVHRNAAVGANQQNDARFR